LTITTQEAVILSHIAKGEPNAEIARELFISVRTVETHIYHIFDKLGVSSRTEAALCALGFGSNIVTKIRDITDDHANEQPDDVYKRLDPTA